MWQGVRSGICFAPPEPRWPERGGVWEREVYPGHDGQTCGQKDPLRWLCASPAWTPVLHCQSFFSVVERNPIRIASACLRSAARRESCVNR